MLIYDKAILKNILMNELNWIEEIAEDYSKNIEKYNEKLQKTLDEWMKTRTIIDDININGVTMNYIMRKQKGLFFDAFNTMNYFIANPSVTEGFKTTSEKIFRRFN